MARFSTFSTHVPLRQRLLVPLALLTVVAFTVLPILPASAVGNAVDLGVNVTQAGPGAQPVAGSTWTYTIHVASSGLDPSTGYTVELTIPASTTVGAHDSRCAVTTRVDCTSTGLASPGSETFDVTVNIPSNYANNTHLVTTATINDWNGDIDANPTNDSAGADAVVITQADLSIQKTGSATPVVPGGSSFTYSLKVTNNGPSDSVGGIVVTDTLPADVNFVPPGVGSSTDAGCSTGNPGVQDVKCTDPATIAAGGTNFRTFVVEVTVNPSHGHGFNDVLLNTASVAPAGGGTTDPNSANNTSNQDSTATHPEADLGLTSVSTSPLGTLGNPAVAGQIITYTATVRNFGPSDAAAYTLSVDINPLTSFHSGSGCGPVGAQVVCNSSGGLALNGSETFTVTFDVFPSFADGGTFANAVTIHPATFEGPSPTHVNTATPIINVVRKADLGVTASASPDGSLGNEAIAGTHETWTVTVHNYGPSDNSSYTLSLPVPAGTTFVSRTGPSCVGTGPFTCTHPLAFGASDGYTIEVSIPSNFANNLSDSQPLPFHTAISGLNPSDQNGNATDDFADANVTVVTRADLSSSVQTPTVNDVTDFGPPLPPSGNRNTITYTMTVTDNGPSDARDVTVKDTLPAQLDGSTAKICVATPPATCDPGVPGTPPTYTSGTLFSLLGASPVFLPNGESRTVVVRAQVLPGPPLRNGPLTTGDNTVTFGSATLRTNGSENSVVTTKTVSFPTVADAPTLVSADPGSQQIGVDWTAGLNDGGSSVTGYDIIVKLLPSGPTQSFFIPRNTLPTLSSGHFGAIVPASPLLSNGALYQVTVEARNGAGDSDPSNSISTSPCLTCIIKQVSPTQTVTLNTGSSTATSCTQKGAGATSTDTYVSCYQFLANGAKRGLPLALNESTFQTGACGGDVCIGNQQVNVNPAGQGAGVVITQYIFVDRSVSTDVFGNPCLKRPCTGGYGTYEYEVFVTHLVQTPNPHLETALVGTSVQKGGGPNNVPPWCTGTSPPNGFACVKSLTALSGSQAPNGNNGAKDLQIIMLLSGDPRIGVSG